MNIDQVIEQHVHAIGGTAAIEGVHRLQIAFHLIEPSFEADGLYRAERKGRMRVDIFMNAVRVFTEGHSGSVGWQLPQDAEHASLASPAGSLALLHGIENHLFGLHELKARGHLVELEGQEDVDDTQYYVIKVVFKDGHTQWRYVNAANGLVERNRERKALHPDVDPAETTIETRFTDFRLVDRGLRRAFHEVQVDLSTGQLLQTTTIGNLLINPLFPSDLFDVP